MILQSRSDMKRAPVCAGFSLIEILMVIILMGVLVGVSIGLIDDDVDEADFESTIDEMEQIKKAMIGDESRMEGGLRTSFGYLGDIGRIPTNAEGITALITRPAALPVWAVTTAVRFGHGWNGPYLISGDSGSNFTTDAWGNLYVYDSTTSPATIISRGTDGAVGGTGYAQDITVTLPIEKRSASVYGFVSNRSAPFSSNAQVALNSVVNGAVSTTLATLIAADVGRFQFASIPFGIRSVTVYVPSQAAPTTTIGPIIVGVDKPNLLVPSEQIDINP